MLSKTHVSHRPSALNLNSILKAVRSSIVNFNTSESFVVKDEERILHEYLCLCISIV